MRGRVEAVHAGRERGVETSSADNTPQRRESDVNTHPDKFCTTFSSGVVAGVCERAEVRARRTRTIELATYRRFLFSGCCWRRHHPFKRSSVVEARERRANRAGTVPSFRQWGRANGQSEARANARRRVEAHGEIRSRYTGEFTIWMVRTSGSSSPSNRGRRPGTVAQRRPGRFHLGCRGKVKQ